MKYIYELKNIEQFYDEKKVLSIENLKLQENQIIGFFGPNGSGKSTLFSLLSFINKASGGRILYKGVDSKNIEHELKQNIVMVPQNPYLLKRTIFENIAYGLKLRNQKENLKEKVKEALSLVGLDESFSKRKWSQLSGGEAQRVALAARLILKPKVLILDEPTTGVDVNSAQLIKEAILIAKQRWKTTILISSHDHTWLNHICDRKVALFKGHLIDSGNINLLFSPWEKGKNGNLVKTFSDGQKLGIKNSKDKKRDSILMIDSNNIRVFKNKPKNISSGDILVAIINSISQESATEEILLDFMVGEVSFKAKVSKEQIQKEAFYPFDKVYIYIDTSKVCWI